MFEPIAIFPSAARTATPTAAIVNIPTEAMYLDIEIETTATGGATSTIVNVEAMTSSGAFVAILASASITATGVIVMRIGPDVATTANLSAPFVLPAAIRVRPVHSNGVSHTYSIVARARG